MTSSDEFFSYDETEFYKSKLENISDKEAIITADGSYKLAVVFNDQLPGPPIVVYRGQQVISIF